MSAVQITYQIQLAEGQTIAFEIGADTEDGADKLRETLDLVGKAAERRKAIHDLPFHQARLMTNRERIVSLRRSRAKADSDATSHLVLLGQNRRREAVMPQTDVNAIAQWDKQIADTEAAIKGDEIRIPYLRAIIDGREPPDLFPEVQEFRAAAE